MTDSGRDVGFFEFFSKRCHVHSSGKLNIKCTRDNVITSSRTANCSNLERTISDVQVAQLVEPLDYLEW